jgi:hypothetical protein
VDEEYLEDIPEKESEKVSDKESMLVVLGMIGFLIILLV